MAIEAILTGLGSVVAVTSVFLFVIRNQNQKLNCKQDKTLCDAYHAKINAGASKRRSQIRQSDTSPLGHDPRDGLGQHLIEPGDPEPGDIQPDYPGGC